MRKLIKIFISLIVIVALLFVITGTLLVTTVNPNKFKQQISQLVLTKTGRTLAINGDIGWSFFPWIGLRLHNVTLSDPPNFPKATFASMGEADINIQVLPLLFKRIHIGELTLRNAQVNLVRNKAGVGNWQMAGNNENANESTTTNTTKSSNKLFALDISTINIENANVNWHDEKSGSHYAIQNLQLHGTNIGLDKFFPLNFQFSLESNQPKLIGQINFASKIKVNLDRQHYQFENLKLDNSLSYASNPNNKLTVSLKTNADINLQKQTIAVNNLLISSNDLQLEGQLTGNNIIDNPALTGKLQLSNLKLKDLLRKLNIPFTTQDATALQTINFATEFNAGKNSLALNDLQARIDDTNINGQVNITNLKNYSGNFALTIDKINLDRYLPDNSAASKSSTTTATAAAPTASPFTSLRNANLSGNLKVGNLIIAKTELTNLNAHVNAQNGIIKISPLTAGIYQGQTHTDLTINARSNIPRFTVNQTITNVQISQLLKSERITGTADVNANVTAAGMSADSITRTLNGNLTFAIHNGTFHGVDLIGQLNRAYALLKKQPMPATAGNNTDFGQTTGTGVITDGVLSNHDLLMQSSSLRVKGDGIVNLVTQTINYHLQAVAMQNITNAQGAQSSEARNTEIPLLVTGTFTKPIIAPDVGAITRMLIKNTVNKELDKVLNGGKDTGKAIQDALGNLFK